MKYLVRKLVFSHKKMIATNLVNLTVSIPACDFRLQKGRGGDPHARSELPGVHVTAGDGKVGRLRHL